MAAVALGFARLAQGEHGGTAALGTRPEIQPDDDPDRSGRRRLVFAGLRVLLRRVRGARAGRGRRTPVAEGRRSVGRRHVLLLPGKGGREVAPELVKAFLRGVDADARRQKWIEVTVTGDELEDRIRFHPDPRVDVALVDVLDQITGLARSGTLAQHHLLRAEDRVGHSNLTAQVGDDVLVAGYPRGFYDTANLFPIVKAGIIASKWGAPFRGNPHFLVDAKLFEGSSGSVVVSSRWTSWSRTGACSTAPRSSSFCSESTPGRTGSPKVLCRSATCR